MTKICTKCGVEKDSSMFHKDTTKPDGLYSSCKACNEAYQKKYFIDNKDARNLNNKHKRNKISNSSWEELSLLYSYNKDTGILYSRNTNLPLRTYINYDYVWVYLDEFQSKYSAHRLIWFLVYKKWVRSIDHINGIKSDNRLTNLRECLPRENSNNLPLHRSGHLPGCHYREDRHKWAAYTRDASGKRIYLGHYVTEKEASLQYCRYVLKYGLVRREFLPNIFTDQELYGDA